MLHPREFVRFLDGRSGATVAIATLPVGLAVRLPAQVTEIRIGQDYALKLQKKHCLRYEHFSLIQTVIDDGWCIVGKQNHLEFLYMDNQIFGSSFILVLKATRAGQEIWVATFHKTDNQRIRSKLRRATRNNGVIRPCTWG